MEETLQNAPNSWKNVKAQYDDVPVKSIRALRDPISVSVDSAVYVEVAKLLKEGLGAKRVHFSLIARLTIFLAYIRHTEQLKPETVGNGRPAVEDLDMLEKVIQTLKHDQGGEFRLKLLDLINQQSSNRKD
ncbi:hypothetical protein [Lacticaseibacillus manihotivorans]|uniref:Uncharacterized protein n=1 Tax=Lacticaseibacillus manihotivorans TaxID=88233 RepID=A0A5P8JN57_9LACO|nr:hypothetical protein [Lacticaseibacillus manihotivorans]QFQ90655.1 hypothetical protein LM010_04070 [Lacticaseibacillus manihotivorans]